MSNRSNPLVGCLLIHLRVSNSKLILCRACTLFSMFFKKSQQVHLDELTSFEKNDDEHEHPFVLCEGFKKG